MFAFRETAALDPDPRSGSRVEVAFTDASLDLREGDRLAADLAALAAAAGVPFARLNQVHGADVVEVSGPRAELPTADGQVTAARGVGLMVRVADCVPVVLADAAAGVVGVAHAGRRGVELDVVTRTVERMRDLGAADVTAWIGPHICGRCYEVPATMREEVAAAVPTTYADTSWGTPALDLGAGVTAQLAASGVVVTEVLGCTLEDPRFHSHRRDGAAAGRFAGLVWLS
ncbi:polyphenol oxidase family protein [Nocardioides carbamazepini]|uniref:polyphenol oxidase family protein n=1 Tax=Nocardioides carbamazepini TaxID=2854259 RepID=UPI00214A1BB7|nr:polyphenol oxidase family protein [Nocardioides carbamazepini]MCR1781617.1 polyphenol oxidase family protein [Nocardioides carbamazepini]